MSRRRLGSEDGMAAVLVLGLSAVLGVVVLVAGLLGAVVVARHRAASAADLAALAAAARALDGSGRACAAARDVASGAGAAVAQCRLEGDTAVVTATVPAPGALRALRMAGGTELRSTARAGPARRAAAESRSADDPDQRQRLRRPTGGAPAAAVTQQTPARPKVPVRFALRCGCGSANLQCAGLYRTSVAPLDTPAKAPREMRGRFSTRQLLKGSGEPAVTAVDRDTAVIQAAGACATKAQV